MNARTIDIVIKIIPSATVLGVIGFCFDFGRSSVDPNPSFSTPSIVKCFPLPDEIVGLLAVVVVIIIALVISAIFRKKIGYYVVLLILAGLAIYAFYVSWFYWAHPWALERDVWVSPLELESIKYTNEEMWTVYYYPTIRYSSQLIISCSAYWIWKKNIIKAKFNLTLEK